MKLIQYHLPKKGKRVGVVTRENEIVDVTTEESSTVLDLLKVSIEEGISLGIILADIQEQLSVNSPQPLIALDQQETSKNSKLRKSKLIPALVS